MTPERDKRPRGVRKGLSLIEVIIALAVIGVLVFSYGVSLTAAVAARRIKFKNMAAALADLQLSALRSFSPTQVPIQTDGEPFGIIFSEGDWAIASDVTAPSGTHVLHTNAADVSGVTSVYPLPKNSYDDFTFSTAVKVDPASPPLWQTGIFFRSPDPQNGYRVYLTSGSLVFERLINGLSTTLYSDVRIVNEDTWHTISVTTNGASISVDLNGINVTSQNDSTYSVGMAGFVTWEGAEVRFDDVVMGSDAWNMDSETLGVVPDGWERFGLSSIPFGDMTLTSEELYSDSGFKRYTVTVTWQDGSNERTLSQSTIVNN